MIKKKMLWKDIFKSLSKSKGRFISIMGLMLLGSFALVGLKVSGPDMRATGDTYFSDLNTADLTIISDMGLDETDQKMINQTKDHKQIEYGYLKDVVLNESTDSFRLFSLGNDISNYELKSGRLPTTIDEIAIDNAYKDDYKLGDTIEFTEKEDITGKKVLKKNKFKVIGYIYSGEIISNVNLGQSTAGTGSLKGYGTVIPDTFDSDVYMLARLTFKDTNSLNSYSNTYTNAIQRHKKEIKELLKEQPSRRLATINTEYQEKIETAQKELDSAKTQLIKTQDELDAAKAQLDEAEATINQTRTLLSNQGFNEDTINQQMSESEKMLIMKQENYKKNEQEFQGKKVKVEKALANKTQELALAKEMLSHLSEPVYSINSRREIPGGDGYKIYSSVSWTIDSLANVFPIFMYLVAALVTFTTMTRFVDEERLNTRTLKALGYSNRDVMKKFTFYGLLSSLLGAVLGIILGHTLLPIIVYNAYHNGFTVPKIELHVHWDVTIIALLLAIASAVLPAWLVAAKEMKEMPSQLLSPKAPASGATIFLEKIKPIWNHMSFTHKVTTRNIFRYKKRMFMTIFGVAGAVSVLFAGFSVKHSISGINDRQFGELIHYSLIVAENDYVTDDQQKDIDALLKEDDIEKSMPIHYEELTKIAGSNRDTQSITLIVPQDSRGFSSYLSLQNRQSHKKITLPNDGVIISERLATLLNVKKGDTIILKDSHQQNIRMTVSDITEMYMGHFAFMSVEGYNHLFKNNYSENAYLVNLKNPSQENTEKQAADFMSISGVKGVVQNTTLTNQIDTIVKSLNQIMKVLIVVAALLGIVILYNLTNINVSERIRELSTIKVLGFYDKEVTLYIYRETILLTLLGILTGFGIGSCLHHYIISLYHQMMSCLTQFYRLVVLLFLRLLSH